MRTTITLTPEAQALVERAMREQGAKFKDVVNDAIVAALAPRDSQEPYRMPELGLGPFLVDVTHALRLSADLEDEELVRKLERGA